MCLVVILGVGMVMVCEMCEVEVLCVATCESAEGDDDGSRVRLDVEIRCVCGWWCCECECVIIRDDDFFEFVLCEVEFVEDVVVRALRVGDDDVETRVARRF